MKGHITISIDYGLQEKLQKLYPNQVSTKINDFLHRLVAFSTHDLTKLDIDKLNKEIEDIDSKISQLEVKRQFMQERLQHYIQIQKEEEEKRKEKEEQAAREQTKCAVCGIPKPNDKMHKFPGGLVCQNCFTPEGVRKVKQLELK